MTHQQYYILYKPYKMISQFTTEHKKRCLADLDFKFPKQIYPLGRLDDNSEGLLLLSNDKSLNVKLLHPSNAHKRVYWVQVHGKPDKAAIKKLEDGVLIRLENEDYLTKPAKAKIITEPKNLPPRAHPVGDHKTTSWIELTLTEGKYHQVRKMTAAVGHQTMRLIRCAIEDLKLENMQPGEVRELKKEQLYKKLNIPLNS